jgi:uncharacterized OB-fold protein
MTAFGAPPLRAPMAMTRLDEEFFAHCAQERLCFQRCTGCGSWRHLPRALCARCGSDAWEWRQSSGRGRLYSWTVTHQAILPGFAEHVPFVVAVVELEEGVRMISALRGVAREDLALDLPLAVAFERVPDGQALPVFGPRGK